MYTRCIFVISMLAHGLGCVQLNISFAKPLNSLGRCGAPVHILFHMQYYTLTAATTHRIWGLLMKDENRETGDFPSSDASLNF